MSTLTALQQAAANLRPLAGPSEPKPLYVIAPNCPVFERYRYENGLSSRVAVYVSCPDQLRGVRDREVVVLDSALCNRDLVSAALMREHQGAITIRWEDLE
jgi:hypothetical protein